MVFQYIPLIATSFLLRNTIIQVGDYGEKNMNDIYDLKEFESEKYISLETYRKNNQSVKTPVWFVIKDDLIYVVTGDKTGKVKRLRNNLQVKFALCTLMGKITGEWVSGTAKILTEEQTKDAVKWRDKKYGFFWKIMSRLDRKKGKQFAFSIKLD